MIRECKGRRKAESGSVGAEIKALNMDWNEGILIHHKIR
jgi:hypothetical protein